MFIGRFQRTDYTDFEEQFLVCSGTLHINHQMIISKNTKELPTSFAEMHRIEKQGHTVKQIDYVFHSRSNENNTT